MSEHLLDIVDRVTLTASIPKKEMRKKA